MCVSYLEYEFTSGASLMYSTHTKTITKGDSGTKEYPRAAQIALHNEIMRCNFTFGATFCGIHIPNMKKRGKIISRRNDIFSFPTCRLSVCCKNTGTSSILEELHKFV
jgi:hypothetical protein